MLFVARKSVPTNQLCRNETLDGKSYLVFPVIMMVEGVHVNNGGSTFYSAEQLSKNPEAWNMKPVVVLHPTEDGTPVSACTKEVIEKQSVGLLLNTIFEEGKLKSEAWIDTCKADKVYPGLVANLQTGCLMEVSIGHFAEDVESVGTWNNEDYQRSVSVIKPDHLALLPNQIGACSVADGAGIPRINSCFDLRTNETMSYEDIRSALCKSLESGTPPDKGRFIEAVYDNTVVYCEYAFGDGKEILFECAYSISEDKVEFGTPVIVRRIVEYVTVNKKETTMDEALKLKLMSAGFSPEGIAAMEGLPKEDLVALSGMEKPKEVEDLPPAIEEEPALTVDQYLQKVPAPFREVLQSGVSLLNNKRQDLVTGIMANARNGFTKQELEAMPIPQLEKLSKLAVKEDYSVGGNPAFRGNTVAEEAMEEVSFNTKEN